MTSSARGSAAATDRGVRSWSSNSVARTIGCEWNRRWLAPSWTTLPSDTSDIPWWWTIQAWTRANGWPVGTLDGV
jgi:hypothetical protein